MNVKFSEFNKLNETEMGFSDIDFDKIQPYGENPDLEYLSLKELGQKGKLAEYLDKGGKVKFGMLKALYHDAVEYKKQREYEKGVAKFFARVIPMALAPVFFPVWLLAQILGGTRALNKIIIPALTMNHKSYDSFVKSLVTKTMNLIEGDIRPFLGKDWYYDVFYVHDGLIKMVRKEHIYEFTNFISEKIKNKPDDEEVPHYWLDNEFRKWLNNKFKVDLPPKD